MNKSTHPSDDLMRVVTRSHERVAGSSSTELHINLLIKLNHGLMIDFLAKHLAPFDLSPVSYFTMIRLYGSSNNQANPSELSDVTGETRTNMTRICDDLVRRKLMHRVHSVEDRRRLDLSLTDEGVKLLHAVLPVVRAKGATLYEVFSDDEKKSLESLMAKLNKSLEANL